MATSEEYIGFVCDQLRGAGEVTRKKMFGEYMVYLNGKPVFTVCDDTVYVKKLECTDRLLASAETGFPYKGAKEHYILDVENADFASEVARAVEAVVPFPKRKK